MTRGLDKLVRLHRWKLEEQRKRLVELELLVQEFRNQIAALDDEVRHEGAIAASDHEAARVLPTYLEAVAMRREKLAASIFEVEREMNEVNETVLESFQELKKYEVVQNGRDQRAVKAMRRKDLQETDAQGVASFNRRIRSSG